jgi:hypothetical protein
MPAPKVATGRPFQTGTCVIIISESSAEGTQPVRTDRYTPARRRSSAAGNDTPRHADARPVSVHRSAPHRCSRLLKHLLTSLEPCPRRAAGLWDGQPQEPLRRGWGRQGVASRRLPRATTRYPEGKPGTLDRRRAGDVAPGTPRGRAALSTGRHTTPIVQDLSQQAAARVPTPAWAVGA